MPPAQASDRPDVLPAAAAAERLRRARRAKGLASAAEAARLQGWNLNTYASNENGNASFSFRKAETYARAFGVRAEWLYAGKGPMKARSQGLPVLGKVAAGAEALFDDDSEMGAAADWLDPGVPEGGIVLTVDGDSMLPRFRHGERLIFGRRHDDPSPLVGHEVMARLDKAEYAVFSRFYGLTGPANFENHYWHLQVCVFVYKNVIHTHTHTHTHTCS